MNQTQHTLPNEELQDYKTTQLQTSLTEEQPKPFVEGPLRIPSYSNPSNICFIACNVIIQKSHAKVKHLIKTLMLQAFTSM